MATAAANPAAAAPSNSERWAAFCAGVAAAWLHARYFASKYLCAAEDMPLVEACEFFLDCLPNSDEVRVFE